MNHPNSRYALTTDGRHAVTQGSELTVYWLHEGHDGRRAWYVMVARVRRGKIVQTVYHGLAGNGAVTK